MKLCFVGHSGGALMGLPAGGSERQVVLLAVSLARRGHDVSLLVPGHAGEDQVIDGVLLRSGWDPTRGVRFVRAVSYRLPALRRALASVHADVYYTRGVTYFAPTVMRAARSVHAVSLLALTSDRDLLPESGRHAFGLGGEAMSRATGRVGHAWFRATALPFVDCVVAQNDEQLRTCEALGLGCRKIPSIVGDMSGVTGDSTSQTDAIWVGNVGYRNRRSKGVEELARIAEKLPDVRFAVVGEMSGLVGGDVHRRLVALPKVTLLGSLAHEETLRHIAASRVVVNTSPSEGVSNVMLEGWALGKPFVSLRVDPNRLLSQRGFGASAGGDEDEMARLLLGLLEDDARREAAGRAARDYVRSVHGADHVCGRFELLARSLAEARSRA